METALTINEAAKVMAISRASVYRLVSLGSLKVRKIQGRSVVLQSDINEFLRALPTLEGKQALG